jgi:hypothetical protein
MAMGALKLFAKNLDKTDLVTLIASTVKVALLDSGYDPDSSATGDYLWATIAANEIAATGGYTLKGFAPGVMSAPVSGTTGFKFVMANAVWTATSGGIAAWNSYVIYVDGAAWGETDPLIGYGYGVDGGASDVAATSEGNDLTITMPTEGWFTRTHAAGE